MIKLVLHLADLVLQLLYFMAQLPDSAAQSAVDVRELVVERGSELPVTVFDKGRLLVERPADVVVLSVAVGSVYILSRASMVG